MTDSYTRAQDSTWPSWKWAIWGQPQLVEITMDGKREVKYDFIDHIDQARTIVKLDSDGKERSFDARYEDSTGASFKYVEKGPLDRLKEGAGRNWQWVDGFATWQTIPRHHGGYRNYLGVVDSGWAYSARNEELSWFTDIVPERGETSVVFVGGTGNTQGKADLWCDGKKLITFDMGQAGDAKWIENGAELSFIFGGDSGVGLSGIYVLRLPASMVRPGMALNLSVKTSSGQGEWFMVHSYRNILETTRQAFTPSPFIPSIAAFTPSVKGVRGVTIGEFEVFLALSGSHRLRSD